MADENDLLYDKPLTEEELEEIKGESVVAKPEVVEEPKQEAPAPEAEKPKPSLIDETLKQSPIGNPLAKNLAGAVKRTGVLNEATQDFVDYAADPLTPLGAGVGDFAVDVFNHFSPWDAPEIPKYRNELSQALREIGSVVIPTIWGTKMLQQAGTTASIKLPLNVPIPGFGKWAVSRDPVVKMFGDLGISAGTGASVDYVSGTSREGDNLMGMLKKKLPKRWADMIPEDWATMDEDSEDLKRDKTVKEGVGIGIFGDLSVGLVRMMNALKGIDFLTAIKPRSSSAKTFFDKNYAADIRKEAILEKLGAAQQGDDIMDVLDDIQADVELAALTREEALDELGKLNRYKNGDQVADEPLLGVHDMFDPEESGTLTPNKRGVIDAMVGAARIQNNKGTRWGRLGTIITEAALKFGLEVKDLSRRTIVNYIKQTIVDSGEWDHLSKAGKTTFEQIDKAGSNLAEILYDPRADRPFLQLILAEGKDLTRGIENLNDVQYNGAMKAIKAYLDDYLNIDTAKAQAYLTTSMAGEISDISEGARLMDDANVIERAQEQILDRLEYLMVEKGLASYIRGSALNYLNTWKRLRLRNKPEELAKAAEDARAATDDALEKIIPRNRRFVNEIREIGKSDPEVLKPLFMAYELTDGNIDSIYKLNKWVENSLGVWKKAVYDFGDTKIPSTVLQGAWGTIYNSLLSGVVTLQKAGLSNSALLLEKPLALFAGAAVGKDMQSIKRGMYAYGAFFDSFAKGAAHMGMVFKKSSLDPHSVPYTIREDLVIKQKNELMVLDAVAEAAEKRGEMGPRVMLNIAENLMDLQSHPVLRLGVNGMNALDGFMRAFLFSAEARFKAYDEALDAGNFDAKAMKAAGEAHYRAGFNEQGFITDEANEYMTREIAMNLDSPMVDGISSILNKVPGLKPFLMFPRTNLNYIGAGWNRTPLGMLAGDYKDFVKDPKAKFEDFTHEEITNALRKRGIDANYRAEAKFKEIQAEIKGRIALGTVLVGMGMWMAISGRLNGDGVYDRQVMKARKELKWKARHFQGLDGNWYEFTNLGPWADWVAGIANLVDNHKMIGVSLMEEPVERLAHIAAATLTGKTPLQGLEPLLAMLSGNEGQWNRWVATFGSAAAPLSGLRNDIGRILSPMMQIHNQDVLDLLRNRNRGLDVIDREYANPLLFDWIDGEVAGSTGNILVDIYNNLSAVKVSGKISPERQFLIDIEWDSTPIMVKGDDGIEYTKHEQSELYSHIGTQQIFTNKVKEIMKTKQGKEFREKLLDIRNHNKGSKEWPKEKFGFIYTELNAAMRQARDIAEGSLSNIDEVNLRRIEKLEREERARMGQMPLDMQNK